MKPLLVLSTAIALTSGYFANEWHKQNVSQEVALKRIVAQEGDARKAYSELSGILKEDASEIFLQKSFADVTLAVMNLRAVHGIDVSTMGPAKLASSGGEHTLESLSETVPNSDLKSIRINVTGSYITYQSFREYLAELEKLPVSVVSLALRDNTFVLGLRIYGK